MKTEQCKFPIINLHGNHSWFIYDHVMDQKHVHMQCKGSEGRGGGGGGDREEKAVYLQKFLDLFKILEM